MRHRSQSSRLAFAAALTCFSLVGIPARGARPAVAVLPFRGPQARLAEAAVVRALKGRARLVPPAAWRRSANKLFARTQSSQDISVVAHDLSVALVFTGAVKRDGRAWQLAVSVRAGSTGKSLEKLKYPLKTPRLSKQVLAQLATEVGRSCADAGQVDQAGPVGAAKPPAGTATLSSSAAERATAGPRPSPAPPPATPHPRPEAPPAAAAEARRTAAPEDARSTKRAAGRPARPRWAPYLEVAAGPTITGRSFTFDPGSEPRFSSGVVAGLRVDLTVYPLASVHRVARGVLAGLGLGATADRPFWPESTSRVDPSQRFATSELRVEGGLRWRIVLYKPIPRPQLLIQVGGGLHTFSIAPAADGREVGPADVAYRYASFGGGLRIHFAEWAYLWALFHYHLVPSSGPIASDQQYGPARSSGLRFQGGLDFFVWKGLRLGALGFYEQFRLRFGVLDPAPAKLASSAIDQYFGGMILVGYVL